MAIDVQKLVAHINRKSWWHVPPVDPLAYHKRGKFFASTFAEAEFYGRPIDEPERVFVNSPLVGDTQSVERKLFGRVVGFDGMSATRRLALDGRMKTIALQRGFDAIVVMAHSGYRKFKTEGKIPRSIELNVIDLRSLQPPVNANGTR